MQNIIIDKPYQFVPPYQGEFWAKTFHVILPFYLRKKYGIESVEFRGLDLLEKSIASNCGIALTPNHCRSCDAMVMGLLGRALKRPFYYMASWHLFMQGNFHSRLVRRLGCFSVYREGVDREAIRAASDILAKGKRPLVLFPEGAVSQSNDVLHPFMEGISVIARSAAKQRGKLRIPGKIVVHPVALKYSLRSDVSSSLRNVLDKIEARFCWRSRELPLPERIIRVGAALLALKEIEYFGEPRGGSIPERVQALIDHLLQRLEKKWLGGKKQPTFAGRVKSLRATILKDMLEERLSEHERRSRWQDLADIYLAVQLCNYPPDYVRSKPTWERMTETVERFEENMTDKERTHGRWHAIVRIGDPIEIPLESVSDGDPLNGKLQHTIQEMLDNLQGERERNP